MVKEMIHLTIDGVAVEVSKDATILEAARSVGIAVPSLCCLKDLNQIAACRVCVVEIEGIQKLVASCNNKVWEGMVVHTNSPRVREARRVNVELLLTQHNCDCPYCIRSGNCEPQKLANHLGLSHPAFHKDVPKTKWDMHFPLIRDASKCIKCMRCVQVCGKVQSLNIWDVSNTGSRATVDVSHGRTIGEADCALCGQCITHCPVGALQARNDTLPAFDYLNDPSIFTVVQIAPAVRAAWGESLGLPREQATVNRLVAALRRMGFDYIFDTNFSADLTIMEEGSEFLHRLSHKEDYALPMFTSCCPGWVRFIKSQYPDMVKNLPTAKSSQQMFGAVAKSYFADIMGIDPHKIRCVSIMPCVAKKQEAAIPVMNNACGDPDVDLALTTREIDRMIRAEHMDVTCLPEEPFESPLGTGSNPPADAFSQAQGMEGRKEAVFEIQGNPIRVAAASGLGNTRRLMEAIRAGKVSYDFVEIMACPGGCAGGGGQPIHEGQELAGVRGQVLYGLDRVNNLRYSHENPSVQKLYRDYLGEPLGHRSHELLHTDHKAWETPQRPRGI